jgi:hypothetical protein
MRQQRELPLGAVPRRCAQCGKSFRAMTDRQWDHVRREHELLSSKHQPLMSESHLIDMENDVRNRATPGPYADHRF